MLIRIHDSAMESFAYSSVQWYLGTTQDALSGLQLIEVGSITFA